MWISGLATPTKRDDEIVYDGVIIDITEARKTEEKLLELRQPWSRAWTASPWPTWTGTSAS